jgi:hypothetical protein
MSLSGKRARGCCGLSGFVWVGIAVGQDCKGAVEAEIPFRWSRK